MSWDDDARPRLTLFGSLRVAAGTEDVTAGLPGRQGRALLACLALHWPDAVSRDDLLEILWPTDPPAAPEAAFSSVLAKLRRALWPDAISGRETLALQLPESAEFDARDAGGQLDAAERALRAGDPAAALAAAEGAAATLSHPLLAGLQGDWLEDWRRHFGELLLRALEATARASLALGGHHLGSAERAAGALVERERFREGAYELLMEAQARRGDIAEALLTFERLRTLLAEELGATPSASVVALHGRLLLEGAPDPAAPVANATAVALPAVTPRLGEGTFVGREECLERLRALWLQCGSGPAAVVLVTGPAGIGKTRLAARFAEEIHADGATVLYGRADDETLAPYQPFVEALRHLLRHGGESLASDTDHELEILGRLLPDLGGATDATTGTDTVDHETLRYRLFEAVAALLARATQRWPVLLVLDDLHWADRPTLLLLRHLLRHPDLSRLLVLGTFRPIDGDPGHPLVDLMGRLRRDRRYESLVLDGLDLEATRALVSDRLQVEATPGFIRQLHEQTGGNAFFIEETVGALVDSEGGLEEPLTQSALDAVGVPEGVAGVILWHVRSLSPEAGDLLRAASVVGREFRLATVEQLIDAPAETVIDALDECIRVRLVVDTPEAPDTFTFAHALVREVLYGQLTSPRRLRLHHRVAQALEGASANPAELAHHYDLARHLAGPEPARRYTILAGQRAGDLFSYDEARDHFRRALELFGAEDEAERCDVLLALGRVQWHMGDGEARQTFLTAADSARRRGAAEQLARAALGLGERYWETAYVGSRFGELLEEAARLLGPDDRPLRALVLARLAENLAFPAQHERAPVLSAEALAIARRLGDADVLIATLLARHVTSLDIRDLEERLMLGDELLNSPGDHVELSAERHQWRLYDLLEAGDVDEARTEQNQLEALASQLRQPLFQTLAVGWRGVLAELAGDVELADHCADECRRFGQRAGAHDTLSTWTAKVFAMRRRDGRLEELVGETEQLALERRPGWLTALGILRAELGDTAAAERIYRQALGRGPQDVPRGIFWLVNVALLSDLCARVGDSDGARVLYAALEPYAHRCVVIGYSSFWGPVDRFLALLAETSGDRDAAGKHLRSALAATRRMRAPLLTADLERRHPGLLTG